MAMICNDIVAVNMYHCLNCHILFPRLVIERPELISLQTEPFPQLRSQPCEPLLDKCHNIRQASIDALGKLMRRTTSQRKPHVVVISDIEAQYFLHLTPPMFRKALLMSAQYHHCEYTYAIMHEQTFKFVFCLYE